MKTLAVVAVLALFGGGIYFSVRKLNPGNDAAPGTIGKPASVVKSICVEPIKNLSHKQVAMDGVDDEFVAQLQKVGFESRKISSGGSQCDATTNAEVVEVSRKKARIDFRLTLTSEQVPRMSSSVEGKSGGKSTAEFAVNADPKEERGAEHEAIVAALEKTALQIDGANKRGLPPWQAKAQ